MPRPRRWSSNPSAARAEQELEALRIADLFGSDSPVFSFEFFPPKTPAGDRALRKTIADLRELDPAFVSVTYGAGGSTRDRTIEITRYVKNEVGLEAMAHLTCVGAARQELEQVLDRLQEAGIENVIALRGDPPQGEDSFQPHPEGLAHATDLVSLIRRDNRPFCVAAACYPETHVEAAGAEQDLQHLIEKVDAGAEVLITQLFFDNTYYFDFVQRARGAGIRLPIVAGIMPITNLAQIERFTGAIGASIPADLHQRLDRYREDNESVERIGVEHAVEQCRELLAGGAPGVHFYTLNKSRATRSILAQVRGDA